MLLTKSLKDSPSTTLPSAYSYTTDQISAIHEANLNRLTTLVQDVYGDQTGTHLMDTLGTVTQTASVKSKDGTYDVTPVARWLHAATTTISDNVLQLYREGHLPPSQITGGSEWMSRVLPPALASKGRGKKAISECVTETREKLDRCERRVREAESLLVRVRGEAEETERKRKEDMKFAASVLAVGTALWCGYRLIRAMASRVRDVEDSYIEWAIE